MTDGESWFYIKHNVSGVWISDNDNVPVCESDKFSVMKIMVTVMCNVQGFHIIDFLHEDASFNSEYIIERILAPLADKKTEIWSSGDERKNMALFG